MANKEVNIYFKVDGLDGYITDLGDLKNALGDAEQATEKLSQSQTSLTDDLDDFEAKISALEGGVKVLAGSAELAAGAFGLLGSDENEFFREVEENVINVIALAQGAIDLSEGFKLLAQNQKIAAIAQRAFNAAANANPYVLLATALVAAAGALITWKLNAEDALPPSAELKEAIKGLGDEDLQKGIDETAARIEALRKIAFGEEDTAVDQAIRAVGDITEAIEASKVRQREIEDDFNTFREEGYSKFLDQVNIFTDEELQARIDFYKNLSEERELDTDEAVAYAILSKTLRLREEQDFQFQQTELLKSATEARDKIIADSTTELEEFVNDRVVAINYELEAVDLVVKSWEQYYKIRKDGDRELAKSTTENVGNTAEQIDSFADQYFKAFNMVVEEPAEAANLLRRDLTAAFTFANDIATLFSKDSEKRAERNFKINTALSLSTAIVNTAEGVTTALTDKTQPSTILRILQTAAVAAAGAAQIATIARQEFNPEGGGLQTPSQSRGVNPAASVNYNFGQTAGQEITLNQQGSNGQAGAPPIRAYVTVNDVNNAQQAQLAVDNLSRL